MGRAGAGHDIRVYERDPEGATYGWGLVFSDVALSFVRDIAPEVYDSITRGQVVFDDMAIVHQGQHVTLAGNTFHRMARIDLLRRCTGIAGRPVCPSSSTAAATTSRSLPTPT